MGLRGRYIDDAVIEWAGEEIGERASEFRNWLLRANLTAAVLVIGVISAVYGVDAKVTGLAIGVVGAGILGIPGQVSKAVLRSTRKFNRLSTLIATTALVRASVLILSAVLGKGASSFVIAVTVAWGLESLISQGMTKSEIPQKRTALELDRLPRSKMRWAVAIAGGAAVAESVDYAIAGVMMPGRGLAAYYFGFQLVAQAQAFVGSSVSQVLVPRLRVARGDTKAEHMEYMAGEKLTTTLSIAMCYGLATIVEPVESIVWHGKWEQSVTPAMILFMAMPWRSRLVPIRSKLMATGEYKALLGQIVVMACTAVLASLIGVMTAGTAVSLSAAIGCGWLVGTEVIRATSCRSGIIERAAYIRTNRQFWKCLLVCAMGFIFTEAVTMKMGDANEAAQVVAKLACYTLFVITWMVMPRLITRYPAD